MNRIILQPCGSAGARSHYNDTILNPVSFERFAKFLPENDINILSELYSKDRIPVWGVVSGENNINVGKWEKIQSGDVTLFSREKKIFASAVVTYKTQNRELAADLWGYDEKGRTWEYLYFLDEVKQQAISYERFNIAVGYKPNFNIYGFSVLGSEKSNKCFETFDLESETYQPDITQNDYESAVKQLVDLESLDTPSRVSARVEQTFLRNYLFGDKKVGRCGICNEEFPVSFLIAAHIKKRSQCCLDEKKDYKSVVMPMCCFGCDSLFEKGYISIKEGKVVRLNVQHSTPDFKDKIDYVVDEECIYWNEESEKYFEWHRNHHSSVIK